MIQGEACPLLSGEAQKQLQRSTVPVFVLDMTERRCVWANAAALRLQGNVSLKEFQKRPFDAVIEDYIPSLDAEVETLARTGGPICRQHSVLIGYRTHSFLITLALTTLRNGHLGVIVEAQRHRDSRKNFVRASVAADEIPSLVIMTMIDGTPLYANKAALNTYGETVPFLSKRMNDPAGRALMTRDLVTKGCWQGVASVKTHAGERWHAITVREVQDPVSGLPAYVTCEIDMTDAIKASEEISFTRKNSLVEQAATN